MNPGTISGAEAAFSAQAPRFDVIDDGNPIIGRMRTIVRRAVMRNYAPGQELLELNAGTGLDALWFAERGLNVLATDAAPGMVARLRERSARFPERVLAVEECSFNELERLGARRFDHVFSNFGGLNCTARLDKVLHDIDGLLRPGGTCALVIMPRFSPWETLALLKGNLRLAYRRWRRSGTPAKVEDIPFTCYYYSPRYVRRELGNDYDVLLQRTLSWFIPPPHLENFPSRWPRSYDALQRLEDATAAYWPFNIGGDHFLIVLRKRS